MYSRFTAFFLLTDITTALNYSVRVYLLMADLILRFMSFERKAFTNSVNLFESQLPVTLLSSCMSCCI